MSKHFHVLQGLSGCYTPDTNSVFVARKEARKSAAWSANQANLELFEVEPIEEPDEEYLRITADLYETRDGNQRIWITTCDLADCKIEE